MIKFSTRIARTVASSSRNFATSSNKSRSTVGLIVFSGICAGTGALGVWQIQRYYWKLDLIEERKNKGSEKPVEMPRFALQEQLLEFIEYNKGKQVNVLGTFEHDKELLMGLRTAPIGIAAPAQGLASNPQGYYVITPMRVQGGALVFVNRGWVPRTQQNWSRPTGSVRISAVVSQQEKGGMFAPPNTPSSGKLFWLEGRALLEGYNSTRSSAAADSAGEAVILEALSTPFSSQGVYPYARHAEEFQQEYVTPMTHLVYAITWFSLSAFGSVMTYIKFIRSKEHLRPQRSCTSSSNTAGSLCSCP